MLNPKGCGLLAMSLVQAKVRVVIGKVVEVFVCACLVISVTLNFQLRTEGELT